MEMRGQVRRGYFVQGLPGIQFALPEAVERLREWSRPDAAGADELVVMSAADPANLFGRAPAGSEAAAPDEAAETDPSRFARLPSNYVVLLRGQPVLLLELGAGQVTTLAGLSEETLRRALRAALDQARRSRRRLALGRWNREPLMNSALAPLLEGLGLVREALVYVWEE
jgi:ATP-dependent Lhr-like helicase